jgi:alkanesulfonate monooxygenase SsuD/methylene tetrahydromethanopterin reductase-like flavin-dependent oxidoreductase (luciferase family)
LPFSQVSVPVWRTMSAFGVASGKELLGRPSKANGGHHEKTLPRIVKWGDGWIQNNFPPDQSALNIFGELRRMIEAEGRDPQSVGIEVWTSCGRGDEADWRAEAAFWKAAGVSHLCLTTAFPLLSQR